MQLQSALPFKPYNIPVIMKRSYFNGENFPVKDENILHCLHCTIVCKAANFSSFSINSVKNIGNLQR